ncbi:peptide ABC transporter substrate-binding protein [Agrococcus sp. Marseille-P2731]|uniref:peptide ABC transporter substrate-binding protein n=1 Tax=Agrococcus sp. Marseille-P2731 TaxID=1841862 RepID=UPI00092FDF39|nr:ABC transporter substrate-binding protein [Agrococcus sp. Marseille-P2731]
MKHHVKVSVAALALVALTVSGCAASDDGGGSEPQESSAEPQTFRMAVEEPDHLIPGNHFASYEITQSLFAPLTGFDDAGELEMVAAESVESDDATTWTITLREGWTFHDGTPVTAQAYVDTWNYAAYGPNAWVNGGQLKNVVGYAEMNPAEGEPEATELAGLEVVDDRTFTVELIGADRQFPFQLTVGQTALYPLPESAWADLEAFDRAPIGNGPFMMESEWEPNAEISVVAYEDYAGEAPTTDGITFVPYLDTTVAYTDALAGAVDIVGIGANQAVQAESDFGERFHAFDAPGVDFLGFPLEDPRFEDPRVRQAISMAIDREAINQAIFNGTQVPATSLTAPSMPGDPAGICGELCEFDPEAARALLEEAGGFEGTMELLFIGGWAQDDLFQAYANQLRENLQLDEVVATPTTDFAAFTERVAQGDLDGPYRARWGALYPSQQDTLHSVYTADGDGNSGAGGYSSAEVDALLAEADAAETLEESLAGYEAAQERILADFPTVPTFANRYLYVTSDRIAELPTISGGIRFAEVVLAQ